jgi:hypothetical protein
MSIDGVAAAVPSSATTSPAAWFARKRGLGRERHRDRRDHGVARPRHVEHTAGTRGKVGVALRREERHPLLAAGDEHGSRVELLPETKARLDQVLVVPDSSPPRLGSFREVRRDHGDAAVPLEMLLLGIHGAGDPPARELREEAIQERRRDDSLAVVGDQHRVHARERLLDARPQLFLHGRGERLARFLVGAQDLLMVGDDAGLEGGAAIRVLDHAAVRFDPARVELAFQALRGRVLAHDPDQNRSRPEGAHVLGHVRRPAEAELLAIHVDDEHRRLGRDARRAAPEVAVQDHVADHEDAPSAEALDARGQGAAREARFRINRLQAVSSPVP